MLLVDNGKAQIFEGNVVLKESVRADQNVDLSGGERREESLAGFAFFSACQKGQRNASGFT